MKFVDQSVVTTPRHLWKTAFIDVIAIYGRCLADSQIRTSSRSHLQTRASLEPNMGLWFQLHLSNHLKLCPKDTRSDIIQVPRKWTRAFLKIWVEEKRNSVDESAKMNQRWYPTDCDYLNERVRSVLPADRTTQQTQWLVYDTLNNM